MGVDVLLDADLADLIRLQRLHGIEELLERAPEAVKPRHCQIVAWPRMIEQDGEARPVEGPPGNDVRERDYRLSRARDR